MGFLSPEDYEEFENAVASHLNKTETDRFSGAAAWKADTQRGSRPEAADLIGQNTVMAEYKS